MEAEHRCRLDRIESTRFRDNAQRRTAEVGRRVLRIGSCQCGSSAHLGYARHRSLFSLSLAPVRPSTSSSFVRRDPNATYSPSFFFRSYTFPPLFHTHTHTHTLCVSSRPTLVVSQSIGRCVCVFGALFPIRISFARSHTRRVDLLFSIGSLFFFFGPHHHPPEHSHSVFFPFERSPSCVLFLNDVHLFGLISLLPFRILLLLPLSWPLPSNNIFHQVILLPDGLCSSESCFAIN